MSQTVTQYSGAGVIGTYAVPFVYLEKSFVEVRIDNVLQTVGIDYVWLTDSSIQTTAVVPSGAVVEIRRNTPKDVRLIDFQDGSILREYALDRNSDQVFHAMQETMDSVESRIGLVGDGTTDGQGRRISNVDDPINPQDVATKAYADAALPALVAQAEAAAVAADNSYDAAVASNAQNVIDVQAIVNQAAVSATNAQNSATAAASSLDSFDDRYLGAKASAPTVDNDGNALLIGALYWDTTVASMKVWGGSSWTPFSGAGAVGGGTDKVFHLNDKVITSDFVIPVGKNAISAGGASGIEIADGATVEISNGSSWVIV